MTVTPLHPTTPRDRAMRPEAVAEEIMSGTKDRDYVIRVVPRECRVPVNTRPPLFWESKVRAWWEGKAS